MIPRSPGPADAGRVAARSVRPGGRAARAWAGDGENPPPIAMTPGFPDTWKPPRSPTWAAVQLPSVPPPGRPRPGARRLAATGAGDSASGSQPAASTVPGHPGGTPAALPRPHASGLAASSHPQGGQGSSDNPQPARCPPPAPTGIGGVVARPLRGQGPATAAGLEYGAEGRGRREEARAGASGRRHSPLAGPEPAARARRPEARVPRRLRARRGLPPRPSGRGRRGGRRRRAALSLTLTPPAGRRGPAPASSLPPAPTAPRAAPQARAGAGASPSSARSAIWARSSCPCPRLPSGDAAPHPRLGALLYPSRSRWPCRAPARGLSPCARLPRCAPEPSGRGPAGVARPRNSMQLRPPPRLLPGAPRGLETARGAVPALPSPASGAGVRGAPRLGGSGRHHPHPSALPMAPSVSRQRNLRNASARAHSHSRIHTHTRTAHTGTRAGGELELGRRSSFLPPQRSCPR